MEEQLITIKTAKLAKEKGFDELCNNYYAGSDTIYKSKENGIHNSFLFAVLSCTAPTQSLLQKWLREKYDIHIGIEPYGDNTYDYVLVSELIESDSDDEYSFATYEDALEAALYEALNLIK
jgi:hypothetical protein